MLDFIKNDIIDNSVDRLFKTQKINNFINFHQSEFDATKFEYQI